VPFLWIPITRSRIAGWKPLLPALTGAAGYQPKATPWVLRVIFERSPKGRERTSLPPIALSLAEIGAETNQLPVELQTYGLAAISR
jgi:hypothetical protein